ncbi:MAG TPA: hypothetical protein VE999_00950 [Gemmataceae bacterium]|nr:hypothetical protein [Gemmataceae bacterium]
MTTTAQMPASNPDVGRLKPEARSRVTNGADILPGVDGRSMTARRYRDISSAIIADQGGEGRLSEARLQLIRRFAAAAVIAEQMEAKLAMGVEINIVEHAQLSSTLVRIAQRIGINRVPKTITPTLADYIDGIADEEAAG